MPVQEPVLQKACVQSLIHLKRVDKMPVHKTPSGKWKWGKSGKEYPTKKQAQRQARAIYASGYKPKKK